MCISANVREWVDRLRVAAETPLLLAVDGRLVGLVSLRDEIRPEAGRFPTTCHPSQWPATAPGQTRDFAIPLDDSVAEALVLLDTQPKATAIPVDRVKFLRFGEARGDHDQVVDTLNAADPHGK